MVEKVVLEQPFLLTRTDTMFFFQNSIIAGQVDRENAVFMFNSSGDPTLMREGNDESAVYVVMPMRV